MAHTLLLADDSPTIAKILGMALQSEGYEIRSVLTAEAAVKELRANPPFFFLVDLTLPEKNGYEFARLVRSESKLKNVRVVLLSSAFEPVDEVEMAACGADGVIAKPFNPGDLRDKLRQVQNMPPKTLGGSATPAAPVADLPPAAPPPSAGPVLPERPVPGAPTEPAEELILADLAPEPSLDEPDILGDLLSLDQPSGDADSILASLMGGEASSFTAPVADSDTPPAFNLDMPPTPPEGTQSIEQSAELTNATVLLDLTSGDEGTPTGDALDLSNSFATPPRGTALLEISRMNAEVAAKVEAAAQAAKETANLAPPSAPPQTPPSPVDEPLSANASALAAFFEAEIQAKESAPSAPPASPATDDDSFDASLSSIDWGGPEKESLDGWSSSPPASKSKEAPPAPPRHVPSMMDIDFSEDPPPMPKGPSSNAAPTAPPFSRPVSPARVAEQPAPVSNRPASRPSSPAPAEDHQKFAGASSDGAGTFLFDTGNSNFRFADDYIQRITKSFTGETDEMVLGKDPSPPVHKQKSDDRATNPVRASHAPAGGGAWSPEEVQRIEQLVRDEVQMVVREIAEKVVWEVVPELAENLIRKELDKVLKEMGE